MVRILLFCGMTYRRNSIGRCKVTIPMTNRLVVWRRFKAVDQMRSIAIVEGSTFETLGKAKKALPGPPDQKAYTASVHWPDGSLATSTYQNCSAGGCDVATTEQMKQALGQARR